VTRLSMHVQSPPPRRHVSCTRSMSHQRYEGVTDGTYLIRLSGPDSIEKTGVAVNHLRIQPDQELVCFTMEVPKRRQQALQTESRQPTDSARDGRHGARQSERRPGAHRTEQNLQRDMLSDFGVTTVVSPQ